MVVVKTIQHLSRQVEEYHNITRQVHQIVEESEVRNGFVAVITAHTTTGILVNESLACLEVDIEKKLEELVPTFASYNHNHFLPSYGAIGCNAPGHLKSMLCGNHAVFPIVDGHVVCGNAQDVYFGEFDGIQRRKVYITVMGE